MPLVRWLAILTAVAALLPAHPGLAQPPRKPNILVVMTDDQRADGTLRVMPRTRRLIAGRGTTFLEAHATTPQCCPSRASFFTGLYVHNHGVFNNDVPDRLDQGRTVQRALRARGYRTAIFGKYLNSWIRDPPHFGTWSITEGGYDRAVWNLGGRVRTVRRYTTDMISDHALRFLRRAERRDGRPWLTWLTPFAPHLPSTPAARHRGASLPRFPSTPAMRERDSSDKPAFLEQARGHPEAIATARGDGRRSLMAVDEMVGRLMAELRRLGETRRTLVVFTSDNGLMLGEHGGLYGKDLPYPAATRIPLLVRWPGRPRRGRASRRLVTNLDVATTLLDVAGARPRTDGRSLLDDWRRGALFMEHRGARSTDGRVVLPAWRSLRTRAYRYAEYRDEEGELIDREYYDLGRDPWELQNAAASLAPDRIGSLARRLRRLARCRGSACP
jgi:arylsulfatase A-like enzyme